MNDILVVSDMADLRATRIDHPELRNMEFLFSCRDGHKLRGWVPDKIFITDRAKINMTPEVDSMIKYRMAQGSAIISCHAS